jgi:imidazolonepropionase-like amidohydrolase
MHISQITQSDHPVMNSRFLLYEAAQAHYYGLPSGPALSAVITTPAEVAGFGHRLGRVQNGYDAGASFLSNS